MREPNLEVWYQRREELAQEAEMNRLGLELRAAQRRASQRPDAQGTGLAGRIGGKITAVRRVSEGKRTVLRLRSRRQHPSGCAK